jgi:hypothetical protein
MLLSDEHGSVLEVRAMINLIPPEGATDTQVDAFIESLRLEGREKVRELLAAGAPEVEVEEYLASLEPASEDSIPSTEGVQ